MRQEPTRHPYHSTTPSTQALEALYDHASDSRAEERCDPTVQFRYAGRVVIVWSVIDINESVTDFQDKPV